MGKKSNGTHYCRKGEGVLIVAHIGRGSTVTVWGVGRTDVVVVFYLYIVDTPIGRRGVII